jgi:hypothetical protein
VPATVRKLGPGVLSVGAAGSPLDFSNRCTSVTVKWGVKTEDDVLTLAGTTESGDRTYTATLEANVYQDDLADGGLIDYTWANKGTVQPATYTPYTGGKSITGEVVIDPIDVGGEVGKKNKADIKWAFVGEPELIDDLG